MNENLSNINMSLSKYMKGYQIYQYFKYIKILVFNIIEMNLIVYQRI